MTVIAGALGSGKTTLVNHVLRQSQGRRIAVLVNDFGDLDIDAAMIESTGAATMSLRNGCICCSLGGGLSEGLAALRAVDGPLDQIVVEASGVSLPRGLVGAVGGPGLRLDAILVVVDAVDITRRAQDRYVGDTVREQIACADALVLNKVDEATAAQLGAARALLAATAPGVPVVETIRGAAPLDVLLGPRVPGRRPTQHTDDGHPGIGGHTDLDTKSFVSEDPIAADALARWLDDLPGSVIRAKGFVRLADNPCSARLVQVVGTRRRITPIERPETISGARLVVIGAPGSLGEDLFEPLTSHTGI